MPKAKKVKPNWPIKLKIPKDGFLTRIYFPEDIHLTYPAQPFREGIPVRKPSEEEEGKNASC